MMISYISFFFLFGWVSGRCRAGSGSGCAGAGMGFSLPGIAFCIFGVIRWLLLFIIIVVHFMGSEPPLKKHSVFFDCSITPAVDLLLQS